MTVPDRPIDLAMRADSPAKNSVRRLWLDKVAELAPAFNDQHPLYFSLTGAEARDIQMLVEAGIVRLNEVGGIDEADLRKCVAVENSPTAVIRLQEVFPGLKIIEKDVGSLIRREGPFAWPEGDERILCAALVVNLDLSGALSVLLDDNDHPSFPQIDWIGKIGRIQRAEQAGDRWTLCLTLNATPNWSESQQRGMGGLLWANAAEHERYRTLVETILNPATVTALSTTAPFADHLAVEDAQKLLCVLVPKLVAEALVPVGWSVTVDRSLLYEGANGAPMVTFIVDMRRAGPGPSLSARLRMAISDFRNGVARVEQDGTIQAL